MRKLETHARTMYKTLCAACDDSTMRFRYGSIIGSTFRIDENPCIIYTFIQYISYILRAKPARGVKLFGNTVSIPSTCVYVCTVFLCTFLCVCIIMYPSPTQLSNLFWRRFVNRFPAQTPSSVFGHIARTPPSKYTHLHT